MIALLANQFCGIPQNRGMVKKEKCKTPMYFLVGLCCERRIADFPLAALAFFLQKKKKHIVHADEQSIVLVAPPILRGKGYLADFLCYSFIIALLGL